MWAKSLTQTCHEALGFLWLPKTYLEHYVQNMSLVPTNVLNGICLSLRSIFDKISMFGTTLMLDSWPIFFVKNQNSSRKINLHPLKLK